MTKSIALLSGDGIGKEVIPAAVTVLKAVAPKWQFEDTPYGADHTLKTGRTISDDEIQALGRHDAILLGALGDPRLPDNRHAKDILLGLRTKLDLYVNFRPCYALNDALVPLKKYAAKHIQFAVFRENTEGLYTGIGGTFKTDTDHEIAIEQEINTRTGVERIIREAFAFAERAGKKRLVMADKANAMPSGHGLWRRTLATVAKDYPAIEARALFVDNVVFQMVRDPSQFDVIVTNNLFGDILTDLAAALQGGLGLAASANYRPGGPALFEPVHGSAPDIAGKGIANPLGAILTAGLMLERLGESEAAVRVTRAVSQTLAQGVLSPDIGGQATTQQVTQAVLTHL